MAENFYQETTKKAKSFDFAQDGLMWSAILFGLSLVIRLPALGAFLTIDEFPWTSGGTVFLESLTTMNWFNVYWNFSPGVTIAWIEALVLGVQYLLASGNDLALFLSTQMENMAVNIFWLRLPLIIIISVAIVGVYRWGSKSFGHWASLVGTILIAFDPFFAGHSRIVNGDATSAILMLLSVLVFAQLFFTSSLNPAILSGVFSGLAILTKVPAPILVPLMIGASLLGAFRDRRWIFWGKVLVLWAGSVLALVFILWPPMWVAPIENLQRVYNDIFEIGELAGRATFFLGQVTDDVGFLFYVYAIPFRLTPISMLGIVLVIIWLVRNFQHEPKPALVATVLLTLILLVLLVGSVTPKKSDRYIMAAFLAINFLAGVGFANWGRVISRKIQNSNQLLRNQLLSQSPLPEIALVVVILFAQMGFIVPEYPYLITYYNPLLGGFREATRKIPVGWGEGLEQAIFWLNSLPDADDKSISSWYGEIAKPYMKGDSRGFSPQDSRSQLRVDYVVFYINQVQREIPSPALIDYFQEQTPVYTVEEDGVPYVWVYKSLDLQETSKKSKPDIVGRAELLGYAVDAAYRADDNVFYPGQANNVMLVFHTSDNDLPANEDFEVKVQANTGELWGDWQSDPSNHWKKGSIIEWSGTFTLPANLPSGEYRLVVRLMDKNINSEVTRFDLGEQALSLGQP